MAEPADAENTISLESLWVLFRKIKLVSYGSSIEMKNGFKVDPEMIYNCYQKEFNAHTHIGMN